MAAGGGRRSVRKTGARAPEAGRQTANSSGRFVATKFSFGACPSTSVEPTICRQQRRAKRAAQRISSAFARARRGARTCVDLTAHAGARYHRRRSRRPLRKRKCAARGCSPQPACPACVCGASSHGPGPADPPRAGTRGLCGFVQRTAAWRASPPGAPPHTWGRRQKQPAQPTCFTTPPCRSMHGRKRMMRAGMLMPIIVAAGLLRCLLAHGRGQLSRCAPPPLSCRATQILQSGTPAVRSLHEPCLSS